MLCMQVCVCVHVVKCLSRSAEGWRVWVGFFQRSQGFSCPVVSDSTHNVTTSSCEGVSLLMRYPLDLYVCVCVRVCVCAFVC